MALTLVWSCLSLNEEGESGAHVKHEQEAQWTLESGRCVCGRENPPVKTWGCSHLLCDLSGFSLTDQGTLSTEGGGKWGLVRDPRSEWGPSFTAQRVGPHQALGTRVLTW